MRYYGLEHTIFEKVSYLTTEQQNQILECIQGIEAADSLLIPRLILTNDNHYCVFRLKTNHASTSIKVSASPIETFIGYMRTEHKLLIGEPTAEKAIEEIGSAVPLTQECTFIIKGRNLESGLPASHEISSIQIRNVLNETFTSTFSNLAQHLALIHLQHKISHDELMQSPILLRSTLSHIQGLAQRLQEATSLKVVVK